jgi:2-keto-3-deoxy-L-rhamnonate aldolase RhmA
MALMIAVDKNCGAELVSRQTPHQSPSYEECHWSALMNRRVFGMSLLGLAAVSRSVFAQQVPSWSAFKPAPGSLKEKMHSGKPIKSAAAPVDSTRSQLQDIIKKAGGGVELFSLDGQHRPLPDERELVRFCKLAEELGAGVQLRIQHQKLAYTTGRYADLGVLAVMVPLVEEVETANEAINNFYYPPLGNRSYGGEFRFGEKPPTDRLKYADWWNGHALLGFQIETLRGAMNARNIVKPGVDWISWGPGDMAFDIERHSNSPFKTIEEAHAYVIEQLKGYDVRLPGQSGG